MEHIRVNKPTARKLYRQGLTITLIPCKVSFERAMEVSAWVKPVEISKETSTRNFNQFDGAVNEFEYYNCCAGLGYYAHYYVNKEEYNKVLEETQNG